MKVYAKRFMVFKLLFIVSILTSIVDLYGHLFLRWITNVSFIVQLCILFLAVVLFLFKPIFNEEGFKYFFGIILVSWDNVESCELLPRNKVRLNMHSKSLIIAIPKKQMSNMRSILKTLGMSNSVEFPTYYTRNKSLGNV